MESATRRPIGRGLLVGVVIVALIVLGSTIYWLADGRVGTPDDFRQRVSDTGLIVEWANSGPRGGTGSVDTSCGPVEVTINEIDDELWIQWAENNEVATPEAIDAVLSCSR
ncbi:MAG: hypothetical protein M3P87_01685 [Actinomycetota bacterium]|nr:hypothetical protein [Actinomycetota bacterium]